MIWCPGSNAYLLGAVADPRPFWPGRVAIGTDSRLTGSRDLLSELAFAAHLGAPLDDVWRMAGPLAADLCGLPWELPELGSRVHSLVLLPVTGSPAGATMARAGRAGLRLVVSRGRPAVGDPDMREVFDAMDEPWLPARLDGRPKLVGRWLLAGLGRLSEPGLKLSETGPAGRPSRVAHRRLEPTLARHETAP
jgi:hypothetical protein